MSMSRILEAAAAIDRAKALLAEINGRTDTVARLDDIRLLCIAATNREALLAAWPGADAPVIPELSDDVREFAAVVLGLLEGKTGVPS